MTLAKDIKNKMDRKNVRTCHSVHPYEREREREREREMHTYSCTM